MENKTMITVEALVKADIESVWECWTMPIHITQWTNASDDWHAPWASNNLRPGGKFLTHMAAKDGSFAFDFEGEYTAVSTNEYLAYTIIGGRSVEITFEKKKNGVQITETFEAENENPVELQQQGWQAILNNFKKYAESKA